MSLAYPLLLEHLSQIHQQTQRAAVTAVKDDEEVHYATTGLDQQLFVSRYLVELPSEERLRAWLHEEQEVLARIAAKQERKPEYRETSMQVLIESAAIERALITMMRTHVRYRWAVAWASTGSKAWEALVSNTSRIGQIVIGTHFHQTHPEVIEKFHRSSNVRFVTDLSGVFHHKIYLFENENGAWSAIVGSANFTRSAFSANDESAILITHLDSGADEAKQQLDEAIEAAWDKAGEKKLTPEWISWYTQMWEQKQETLRGLAGQFGHKKQRKGQHQLPADHDGGKGAGEIPLLNLSWKAYVHAIKKEKKGSVYEDRLKVLEGIGEIFRKHDAFGSMDLDDRNRIAGTVPKNSKLVERDGVDWAWFGRMFGSGIFLKAVKEQSHAIGAALDAIPLSGNIDRSTYKAFSSAIKRVPGTGIANATRLLAMKRPDIFVGIDTLNSKALKKLFSVKSKIDLDTYWDSIIPRIQQSIWWNTPCPSGRLERRIWLGRAALLDAIC